jgi:hypothetical protein
VHTVAAARTVGVRIAALVGKLVLEWEVLGTGRVVLGKSVGPVDVVLDSQHLRVVAFDLQIAFAFATADGAESFLESMYCWLGSTAGIWQHWLHWWRR